MQKVIGQKDPVMKLLRELQNETGRERNNKFFVEGVELISRAIDFGAETEDIILDDKFCHTGEGEQLLAKAVSAGINVHSSTYGLLSKILEAKPVPACLAIVKRQLSSVTDILQAPYPLVTLVEHGESADNLGMLLRSADAAGVSGVMLSTDTTDPFSRRSVRASRGAVFTVPICAVHNCAEVLTTARDDGFQIVAASASADTDYAEIDYRVPTVVVLGNEHTGISSDVRNLSNAVVRIPMLGRMSSLNISVAASILLYEAVRQRTEGRK